MVPTGVPTVRACAWDERNSNDTANITLILTTDFFIQTLRFFGPYDRCFFFKYSDSHFCEQKCSIFPLIFRDTDLLRGRYTPHCGSRTISSPALLFESVPDTGRVGRNSSRKAQKTATTRKTVNSWRKPETSRNNPGSRMILPRSPICHVYYLFCEATVSISCLGCNLSVSSSKFQVSGPMSQVPRCKSHSKSNVQNPKELVGAYMRAWVCAFTVAITPVCHRESRYSKRLNNSKRDVAILRSIMP